MVGLRAKAMLFFSVLNLSASFYSHAAVVGLNGPSEFAPSQTELQIGDAAPAFNLPGTDGRSHSLAEYASSPVLMIAFLSNHCPDSNATAPRLIKFAKEYGSKGVQIVAINPNNPDGVSIDELGYSSYSDGFEDMKRYSADMGFIFPYLYDGETQQIAAAYGCLCTPHVFIFDANRKLRYKGQFDDSNYADPASVTTTDARNAIDDLLAGHPVRLAITKPHGCSTKWISKHAGIVKKTKTWNTTPVELAGIDKAGVQKLLAKTHGRMRLYNVWATWCVPCVEEFPQLVQIQRRFSARHFDFINFSVDDPNHAARAKVFLEKQGAGLTSKQLAAAKKTGRTTNSYIYHGKNMSELLNTLDLEWPGGIPYTLLVADDGRILWRHSGAVTEDMVREEILKHLGRTFIPGVDR